MLRLTLLLVLAALACHAAPASDNEAVNRLYRSLVIDDYETALSQTKNLEKEQRGNVITKAVDKLLEENQPNVIYFAYYLWTHDAQDTVKNYFPLEFRVILGERTVKLINKKYGMELKVGKSADYEGDSTVYGDNSHVGLRAVWKFLPREGPNKKVCFKIYNPNDHQYLKSGNSADSDHDHLIYTSTVSDTFRHQWYLEPVVFNKELLFYIVNRQYSERMKLGLSTDSDSDRQAYGHGGDSSGDPERFRWKIVRYYKI